MGVDACRFVSNRAMDHTAPPIRSEMTDQRLTDLEIKASFTEDTLEQLNLVVVRQQREIEWLLREVKQLRQQMPEGSATAAISRASEELPPHY